MVWKKDKIKWRYSIYVQGCNKGILLAASVIVMLCICGAGVVAYLVVRIKPDPTAAPIHETHISFEISQRTLFFGEKNVSMICNVLNYAGLRRVDILHEKDETGTIEIIATIPTNSSYINNSSMTLIEQKMNADSAIMRTVFVSALTCQDKGRYYCTASGDLVSNDTLYLDPLRKPHQPTLLLSRDIVEGKRNVVPFTCEGGVGYPAGTLVLESNSANYFFPTITDINTTNSEETCEANQKITFYYAFSRSWQGKKIRCSAVNNNSLGLDEEPPFDSQIIQVVPADYCRNLLDGSYYHPYNCSYYINCANGSVNIRECSDGQCFGLNETSGCNVCRKAKCVSDVIADVCSKSNEDKIVPFSEVRCSMYVNCTEKMVHECPGNECFNVNNKTCASWKSPPSCKEIVCIVSGATTGLNATIVCPINNVHVTSVEVRVTPGRSEGWEMFFVTGVNGLGVLQGNIAATLTLSRAISNQTLSISLHPLQCRQVGQYIININNDICGRFNVTDKADVPHISVSNVTHENSTLEITCLGNVGAPAKQIFFEAQFYGNSIFQMFSTVNTTNYTSNDCDNEREAKCIITATLNWNNSLVKCSVRNEDNSVLSSEQRRINIVRPSVTLEPSISSMYIGDKDFLMTCVVSNYIDLRRVELYHESERLGTKDNIANITDQSKSTQKSGISLVDPVIMPDYSFLRVKFTNPLTCNDDGQYHCVAIGNVTLTSSMKLVISRRPNKPTLLLSRDIVEGKENRVELPHTCEGYVDYPAGKLLLESNFTKLFYPTVMKINTTISNQTCETFQKITFRHAFSRSWHGKELRCSAVKDKSLEKNEIPPFDAKVVEVVPADYCINRSDQHYYHPYNCSNYIHCVSRTVQIGVCPGTLCFGLNETNGCEFCNKVECVSDVVVCSRTNAELVPYTHIICSMYVNCTDRMVHECPRKECFNVSNKTCPSWTNATTSKNLTGIMCSISESTIGLNATILCTVGDVNVTSVSVYVLSGLNIELGMFNVDDVSGPGVLRINDEASLTLSGTGANQTLSISLHPLQCHHIGLYSINVNNELGGEISITDQAEVPHIFMPNVTNENGTLEIRCRGNVGTPAKEIFIEVQVYGNASFYMITAKNTTTATFKNCNYERKTTLTLRATINWNNSLVRCSVQNGNKNVLSSEQRRINIIKTTVTLEPSKIEVFIGDMDFYMKCNVSNHPQLSRVDIYHESEKFDTSNIVYKQNMSNHVILEIRFPNPLTCNDDGQYHCVAIGENNFTSSIQLNIFSEPEVPTLTLSPWIVENKTILADRMFRCDGMVGRPSSLMLVEANISGSFQPYKFNSSNITSRTEVNCNTNLSYSFYYKFDMNWHGRSIRCSVNNSRTNVMVSSSPQTVEVVRADYCDGKGDNKRYPHPYECTKFIRCDQNSVSAVYSCPNKQCFGNKEIIKDACEFCYDTKYGRRVLNVDCLLGARI